jgi:hypothetical protein
MLDVHTENIGEHSMAEVDIATIDEAMALLASADRPYGLAA